MNSSYLIWTFTFITGSLRIAWLDRSPGQADRYNRNANDLSRYAPGGAKGVVSAFKLLMKIPCRCIVSDNLECRYPVS